MSDDTLKQTFLDAIKADPYDRLSRLALADWLEERGLDDEAAFQREWTAVRQVAAEVFVANVAEDCEVDSQFILDAMEKYITKGLVSFLEIELPDSVRNRKDELWEYCEFLMGRKAPMEKRGHMFLIGEDPYTGCPGCAGDDDEDEYRCAC